MQKLVFSMKKENRHLGQVLVIAQFSLLAFIVVNGDYSFKSFQTIALVVGLCVGVWAIVAMKMKVSVFPEANHVSVLTLSGPYKLIRHPMYTAVLLVSLAFVNTFMSLLAWVVLVLILLIKLHYEEKLLLEKFKEYKQYKHKTKRLIPFIY